MRTKMMLAVLAALALLAFAAGCPRNDGSETDATPPAAVGNQPPTTPSATPPAASPTDVPATPADGTTPPAADGTTPPATDGTAAPPADGSATPPADAAPPAAQGSTASSETPVVVLETTKGNIEITIHRDWAPIGAAHFLDLVNAKFYDGAPWFRVLEGFVCQAGTSEDPAKNAEWGPKTIQDEPLKQGNTVGMVCFGKSSRPNSRSTHIFINLADNTGSLDPQGFACFGEVTTGMDIAQSLFRISDQAFMMSGLSQPALTTAEGLAAFKKAFPEADYIKRAYVK